MSLQSDRLVTETVAVGEAVSLWQRISWGAVIAGIVVSLVIHFFLNLLGLGIGVATLDPLSGESPEAQTLSITAGIWWAASGVIAAAAGGWIAGRMSGALRNGDGAVHGFVTWSATTLIIVFVLTSLIGGIAGGAFSLVGNAMSSAATVASDDGRIDPRVAQALGNLVTSGGTLSPQDRAAAIDALVDTGLSREQATGMVDRLSAPEGQAPAAGTSEAPAETETRAAAERTADIVSQAALWSVVALLLGAIAGALGGMGGVARDTELVAAGPTTRVQVR